jgi:glycosyltransferase involved in cell wall biosynthesis
MKVLLVGNYEADGQRSMERFGKMLLEGLREEGIEVEMVRPKVVVGGGNKWLGYVDKFVLFWVVIWLAGRGKDVVHILDQGNGVYASRRRTCVLNAHDLLAIRKARGEFAGEKTRFSGRILQWMILGGLRRAGAIVSVSEATREDVRRLIGESEMIPNAVEDFWKPVEGEKGDYLLHVGGGPWYKNRAGVVRVFIEVRTRTRHAPRLVMVGPELDETLTGELKEAGLEGEVTVLTDVTDERLRELYSGARVLIFPSLAEGFGWPILEAQACGCPVVTTAREPMRTTGGEAAVYAEPGEWTKGVIEVLEMSEGRRAALVAAGIENAKRYSVKEFARAYAAFYRRHARR